jgi:hypothetical protein
MIRSSITLGLAGCAIAATASFTSVGPASAAPALEPPAAPVGIGSDAPNQWWWWWGDNADLAMYDFWVMAPPGELHAVGSVEQPPFVYPPDANVVYEQMCMGGKGSTAPRRGPYAHQEVTVHVLLQC